MPDTVKRIPALVILAALLALPGCSSGKPAPATNPTASPAATVSAGPAAFLADVARVGFGTKDATDPAFVTVGNTACQGLADGVSYGQQVTAFVASDAHPTQTQAETLVRSAVRNLCPERSGMLP